MKQKILVLLLVTSCALQAGGAPPTPTISENTIKNVKGSFIIGTATTGLLLVTKALCFISQDPAPMCNGLPEGSNITPFAAGVGLTVGSLYLLLKEQNNL